MNGFPTIGDVVGYLRGRGLEGMALAVERLEANYANCRAANNTNMKAIEELRARYEPRPFRYSDHRPPAEASD